jgi:hypothetical protein
MGRWQSWRKRALVASAALAVVAAAAAISFGPFVRRAVAREADRRGLDVEVESVRPAWVGVRLLGVHVRPRGTTGIDAHVDEVRAELVDGGRRVVARGGRVELHGTVADLRVEMEAWRARTRASDGGGGGGGVTSVSVEGIAVRWEGGEEGTVEADGVHAERGAVGAAHVHAKHAGVDVTARGAAVSFGEHLALERVHANAVDATVSLPAGPRAGTAGPPSAGEHAVDPMHLLAARALAVQAASRVADRLPVGAAVDVAALTVHARPLADARGTDNGEAEDATATTATATTTATNRKELDLGPAEVRVERFEDRVELTATSREDGEGHPPASLRATLPLDDGALHLVADGGPVTLAALGLRDRTYGLTDLDRANVAGHADLAIDAAGRALTFDVDVRVRKLGIDQRRLATSTVHDLAVDVRARGALADDGAIAVDDGEVALGAARAHVSGKAQLKGPPAFDVRFDVPRSWCKALVEELPESLVPTVHGTEWDGDFEARGRFAFDAKRPDAMVLDYDVHDDCKVTSVPERLSLSHFRQPFTYVAYDREGNPREETMGPGTSHWTPLSAMSRYLPLAVIMTEDGGFYRKDGFNHPQIKLAFETDLKERRFARGASTLVMQLAKNLFLARDKTIARKLEQVLLTEVIGQTYPKDAVLELYLNVVELGPDVYGARDGAIFYFGKGPWSLTLGESLFMASMLPSPVKLSRLRGLGEAPPAYVSSIDHLIDLAQQIHLVTAEEADEANTQPIRFVGWGPPPTAAP